MIRFRLRLTVLLAVVPLLAVGGCGCASSPPPQNTIHFVEQLYDGNVLLPGMADDGSWVTQATPVVRPGFIKYGSGSGFRVNSWSGWGSSRAVGSGTFGDHGLSVRGKVALTQPRRCGNKRVYTRLQMDLTGTIPTGLRPFNGMVVRIEGC